MLRMKKYITLVLFLMCLSTFMSAFSQDLITVKGKITDNDGFGLPGATIIIENTNTGAISDFDGIFTLEKVQSEATLLIKYTGYQDQKVAINNRSFIDIQLKVSESQLNEVVIIGYAEESRRNVTGVVEKIEAKELVKTPTTNFDQALAGRISGVQVNSIDGQPGESLNIVIRGGNSITGDNSPLYVVDGIPLDDFDPASISTKDIKDFQVLKDASESAIYGSRGANGVIIINTKDGGRNNKTTVEFGTRQNFQWIPNTLPVLDPFQYVTYQRNIALANDNYNPGQALEQFNRFWGDPEFYRDIEGTNWQNEIFQLGTTNQYNLSISGGTKKSSIYFSSEFLDQEGTLINTGFKKFTNSFKINHSLNDKTRFRGQLSYNSNTRSGLAVSAGTRRVSVIRDAIRFRPVEPLNDDGLLAGGIDPNNPNQRFIFDPVKNLNNTDRQNRRDVIRGGIGVQHNFNESWTLKLDGNYQIDSRRESTFFGRETQQGTNGNDGINGNIRFRRFQTIGGTGTLNYRKWFGKNNINFLVGSEFQDRRVEDARLQNNRIPTDIFGINNLGIGTTPSIPTSGLTASTLVSYFGRFKYNLNRKYIFTATFRADGSSRFQGDNKFGYFPSLSGAWHIGEEKFISNIDAISYLKLRAGWGLAGNNRIGDFDSLTQLSINSDSGAVFGEGQEFTPGAVLTNLGLDNLKWETTEQIDIGLELGLFDNRINLTSDVYRKRTTDLLLNAEVAQHTGLSRIQQNIGETENKGLEFSVDAKIIDNKKFKWNSSFNIAFNRTKVIALNRGQEQILTDPLWSRDAPENQYITRVGQPVGQIYGLQFDGIYQIDDFNFDANTQVFSLKDGIPDNGALPVAPGSVRFVDQNGDGTVNNEDRIIIGNPQPKHIGGWNNSFQIGAFDISALLQWSYDFDILNANRAAFAVPNTTNNNGFVELADAYSPTNTNTNINTTRFQNVFGAPPVGNNIDDRYVEDGSFLRLSTVTLGFTFPKQLLEKLKMENMRIYFSGQNLALWTDYSGYDPDVSVGPFGALTPNLDYAAYPASRTVSFGLDVTF